MGNFSEQVWVLSDERHQASGRAFHVAFTTQAQEAFLEGHVLGFAHFGGVPALVRYDCEDLRVPFRAVA